MFIEANAIFLELTSDHCQISQTLKYFDHRMVTVCNLLKEYCDILNWIESAVTLWETVRVIVPVGFNDEC